jgi:hypothetical protein
MKPESVATTREKLHSWLTKFAKALVTRMLTDGAPKRQASTTFIALVAQMRELRLTLHGN